MNNEKMGRLIADRRKAKGFTQKALAMQLHVTDKAVSKWERGLSCPDISLLNRLADILEVTVSELLSGDAPVPSQTAEAEAMVHTALQYADTATREKVGDIRKIIAWTLWGASFLAVLTCIICDFAISGGLTWAWYPISSIVFFCAVSSPVLFGGKRGVLPFLCLFSLLILPFLYSLEKIIGTAGLLMPVGIPVTAASLGYLWVVYLLLRRGKRPLFVSGALSILLGIPLTLGINLILSRLIGEPIVDIWDILTFAVLAICAGIIWRVGYIRRQGGGRFCRFLFFCLGFFM